ncbi:hypothetical protein WCE03_23540 [Pseudomonas guariconensis]|uniref:hypothetical protein n=1 Tax=Pseudomonas guariconensis TaxID=1288410 RepID=UPI0034D3D6EA
MRRIAFSGTVTLLLISTLYAAKQIVQTSPLYPWPVYLLSSFADILIPLRNALAI